MDYETPPSPLNPENEERKAGFEFEFANLDVEKSCKIITDLFGGSIKHKHSLEADIEDTSLGKFKVELDSQIVKNWIISLEKEKSEIEDIDELKMQLSRFIGDAAGQIVPYEIVTPPIKFSQFNEITKLLDKLRKEKAEGTGAAFAYAFGLHINPEIASKEAQHIGSILKAFLILYPWMVQVMDIDITRRILTYIDPFPKDYIKLILAEDYSYDLDKLFDDYIKYNPTRNRSLDLTPLIAELRPEKIKKLEKEDRELIKARPAFHYRLPNCEIDNPNWSVAKEWNYWIKVEKLAADKEKLDEMAKEYLKFLDKPFSSIRSQWIEKTITRFGYDKIP